MDYIKPVQVMLIDDDEINNFIVEILIKKVYKSSSVFTCLNTENALQALINLKAIDGKLPDYIFLEVNSPDLNGWLFLDEYERLRIDDNNVGRIIVLTCSIYQPNKERALHYHSIGGYIIKPLSVEHLRSALNEKNRLRNN